MKWVAYVYFYGAEWQGIKGGTLLPGSLRELRDLKVAIGFEWWELEVPVGFRRTVRR